MQWNVLVTKRPLIGGAFLVQEVKSTGDCIGICDKHPPCWSINFNWVNFLCELNKADVHIAPQSLISSKGFVYLDNPWIKFQLVSCKNVFVGSSEHSIFRWIWKLIPKIKMLLVNSVFNVLFGHMFFYSASFLQRCYNKVSADFISQILHFNIA